MAQPSESVGATTSPAEVLAAREALLDDLFTHHVPDVAQISDMRNIREAARLLAARIDALVPACPDRTDAMRKLQECVNTANRAITLRGKAYR